MVNRNHAQGPHVVDQHGVLLGQRTGSSGRCEAIGGPATPKGITEVVIDPATETQRTIGAKTHRVLDSVVAHELLHTCNVWHHGHFDALVWWQTEKDAASGATVFKEYSSRDAFLAGAPGLLVVVECEDGTPFRPLGVGLGARITLGNQRGQHSGCESCVMRYSFADAAVPKIGNVRYFLTEFGRQEEPGAGLCTTAVGTGVNAPSRSPRARYGNAAEGRGNCADQIRVNDAY
ncbi:hypothetical protein LLH23_01675 [bacterium]|nr:hypothetical protein [bacterium]